jgi:hypothetical protein
MEEFKRNPIGYIVSVVAIVIMVGRYVIKDKLKELNDKQKSIS